MATAMARVTDPSQLNGRQKAAILCMILGAETAAKITQQLSQEEVETISFEIARMDHVSGAMTESVLNEWVDLLRAADFLASGGVDYAREVLERAYGPAKATAMLKRIQNQLADTAGLQRLRNADPQQLSATLRGEHPQTIALILAHLEPPQTAAVLKEIDPEIGSQVVFRMAKMEKVSPEMLRLIERSLGSETDLAMSQGMSKSGGPEAVAAVLNLINPALEKELMDRLALRDKALVDQIKNLMFVFEDVLTLDDRAVQRLLREVDAKELALALKVASEELRAKIMGAMSQRAVASLKEEMEFLGPVRMRDVETAQSNIVAQVRALEESGEIVISAGTDDLVL